MLFEVILQGEVKMQTSDKACIPPKDLLKKMQQVGYKFKLDGKPYAVK